MSNEGRIHESCASDRLAEFQAANPNLSLDGIEFIKLPFNQEGCVPEWMWMQVTSFNNDKKVGVGILSNDPTFLTNIQADDIVPFNYKNISQVLVKE